MMVILGSIRKSLQASVRNKVVRIQACYKKLGILFNNGNSKELLRLVDGEEDIDEKGAPCSRTCLNCPSETPSTQQYNQTKSNAHIGK